MNSFTSLSQIINYIKMLPQADFYFIRNGILVKIKVAL